MSDERDRLEQAKATAQKAAAARVKELEAKHESAGAALYAGLCRAAIERILAGPEKWVDQPHDIMLRLESYIRRAEALEAAEAENEALRAEALRHAGECARHAADDRAVIADLKVEVQQAKDEGARRLMARENETDELIKAAERERDEARAERDRLRESRDGMLREAVRALEHWLAKGAKVVWTPYLTPSACRELLRAAGFYGADQLEHARAALASGEESRDPASAEPAEEPGR